MNKRNIVIICIVVVILLIIGYLLLNGNKEEKKDPNVVDIEVNYQGKDNNVNPSINIAPLYDENGIVSINYFDFNVSSTIDTRKVYYEVILVPKSTNTINESAVKVYLTDQKNNVIRGVTPLYSLPNSSKGEGKVLYRGLIKTNNEKTTKTDFNDFRLRMWLNNDYKETITGLFEFDILINAEYVSDDYLINDSAPLTLANINGNVLTGESISTDILTSSDGVLTCISSNETLATCTITNKKLIINGIKAGEVVITVNQTASDVYSRIGTVSYSLTITSAKSPSQMSLSVESSSLFVGAEKTIEIITNGDGIITCASSNSKVATCSVSGKSLKVKGQSSGNAVITISQKEGEAMLAPTDVKFTVTDVKNTAATTISAVVELETVPYGKIYNGSNPNNYLWFNNEQWRILGVYGDYLKIVRAEPYATDQVYSSDIKSKASWEGSAIQKYLSDNYDLIINDENSRNMVLEDAAWSVGSTKPQIDAEGAYDASIKKEWNGKIGLIASYEYQYSSPKSCWTTTGDNYDSKCGNNWLYGMLTNNGSTDGAWTMSPDNSNGRALRVHSRKLIDDNPVDSILCVSPVVYLKKEVGITGGNGTIGETGSYKLGF